MVESSGRHTYMYVQAQNITLHAMLQAHARSYKQLPLVLPPMCFLKLCSVQWLDLLAVLSERILYVHKISTLT